MRRLSRVPRLKPQRRRDEALKVERTTRPAVAGLFLCQHIQQIREIERDVLDRYHLKFPLLRLSEDLAIVRLLKNASAVFRQKPPIDSTWHPSRLGLHHFYANTTRALSHCLRWVGSDCVPGPAIQSINSENEDDEAFSLLAWSFKYHKIATYHVAWSNSLINATIDEAIRAITFETMVAFDAQVLHQQMADDLSRWDEEVKIFPSDDFVKIFNVWQKHTQWTERGLEFEPALIRSQAFFEAMIEWSRNSIFPELPGEIELGQYNLSELRTFHAAVHSICECIVTLENEVDKQVGPDNRMGSWVLQAPRNIFLNWLRELSGLHPSKVGPLLGDLTFNPKRFHAAITATPFVSSRSGTIFLAPRLFYSVNPHQMFATAMTSGTGRKSYDKISQMLEQFHLDRIEVALRAAGLSVWREPCLRLGSSVSTPDFVLMDASSNQVLIVD